MMPLEHISLLRGDIGTNEAFTDHLESFAENHHVGLEGWLDIQWRELLVAETDNEKKAALDKLERQYKRLEFISEQ